MKRPSFLLAASCLAAGALWAADDTTGAAAAARPNFVVFLVDDLGVMDIGANNPRTFYETPNVDRLAATGMRFTAGYAACPVCSPTRAALLTGKYPPRTGITDYIGTHTPENWSRPTRLLPAPYRNRLAHEETTIAEALKSAGYATFFAGKWHLGPEGWWPEDQGFDINKGGIERGGPYGGKKYFSPYGNPRLEDGPDGEHLPDRLAAETVKFIEANRERPFFATLSFYSVHTPLMARPDLEDKYKAKAKTVKASGPAWGKERERRVRRVQDHAVYAGMVEAMDQAVGKVLGAIDRLQLAGNTVVVFTSDNGGLSTSEGHPTSNLPYRAGKGWVYEGGIRVATIIRAPGAGKTGALCDTPVISQDIPATILDLAGLPDAAPARADGVSLAPLLRGGELAPRPLFWHYPHYGNQGGAPAGAIRDGDWKLIEWYEDGALELYNLRADEAESRDLAAENPDRVRELRSRLAAWRREVGALMPSPNPKAPAAPPPPPAPRPNIVFFLADDLGYTDVSYHGSEIRTPNIDRLAAAGAKLESFYAQPVCSPTRAALLTGRYPMRHGLQVGVVRPFAQYGLPLQERTLPEALKAAGYSTAIAGKWHLGHFRPEYLPTRRGFDHQYGHYNGALDYFTHIRDGGFDWHRDDRICRDEGYTTVLLGNEAVRIIEEHDASRPLFLYVPFNAPHTPLQALPEHLELYKDIQDRKRRAFAAMVHAVDEQVGRIAAAIDKRGLTGNTLFIFSSDNGGPTSLGATNGMLRAGKGTLYEGGVRVAAFAAWTGRIPAGSTVNEPLHIADWYPTLLNLAGASREQGLPLDGRDAWPAIAQGKPTPHESILLNTTPSDGAIRAGDWKLVIHRRAAGAGEPGSAGKKKRRKADAGGELIELFNLAEDISEAHNLASENPDKVKELRARLETYAREAAPPQSRPKDPAFRSPAVWGEGNE